LIVITKAPAECAQGEVADFITLVLAGGEVMANGLEVRVQNAYALFFLRNEDQTIGICALKRANAKYRDAVFQKAKARAPAADFLLELGWVFVLPTWRGHKLSHLLAHAAATYAAGATLFATSRATNSQMHRALIKAGFVRHGEDYLSGRGAGGLALFLRAAKNAS
jgi:GNAT superfamily N-acetyltransferase